MSDTIDARGFSCPQPVLMTLNEINDRDKGEITVMVDTETAKENVTRAAGKKGWDVVDIQIEETDIKMTLKKD